MSVVTNVILTCSLGESSAIDELNSWMNDDCSYGNFKDVRPAAGGNKSVEAGVWAGAFNALNVDDLSDWVKACSWRDPLSVRVFVQRQHENVFSEYEKARP